MKHIAYLFCARSKRIGSLLAFAVVLAAITGTPATASHSPQYGGTLRVQLHERIATLDPRKWPRNSLQAAASERLGTLVFDRLVGFDDHGVLQPALAVAWQHNAQAKQWQFRLRARVSFTDGSACTPEIVATALRMLLGGDFTVRATVDSVLIDADHAVPLLASQFAAGPYFIFKETPDGTTLGTGPFRVSEWVTGAGRASAVFTANEKYWAGRPFVDKIELTMGMDTQQQGNAIAFGQADLVDLPASLVTGISRRRVRTSSSESCDLYALQLISPGAERRTAKVGQAISLAIDRASIAGVILQGQATVSGGLLPNWLSGYAFLFPAAIDVAGAKGLLTAADKELFRVAPMLLVYDSADVDARPVAERVAVNLREIGIVTQISTHGVSGTTPADLRLRRHHMNIPDADVALGALLKDFGNFRSMPATLEDNYAAERAFLDEFRVIPLVYISENYALGSRVRDWMPPRWGGWRLEQVWLAPVVDGSTR